MDGAAGRIRTHDPLVRSQVLYPTELQPHWAQIITCTNLGPKSYSAVIYIEIFFNFGFLLTQIQIKSMQHTRKK